MIEPFFFRNGRLFGCYHPASDMSANRLLIICPPLFDEYRRSYRALADLANACAGEGVHVLRFDFLGTGESFGELHEVHLADWLGDIEAAIEEGLALTGAEQVTLLGVRFGATLAAQSRHGAITRFVFWDPVDAGADYLAWLERIDSNMLSSHRKLCQSINYPFEDINYEAFRLNDAMRSALRKLAFDYRQCAARAPTFVITSSSRRMARAKDENVEYAGVEYDWPMYDNGVLVLKPVLELAAAKVLNTVE